VRPLSKPIVLVSAVALAGLAGSLVAAPSDAADKLAFSHTVVIDPQRLGSEPIIKTDPSGGLYGSSIIGFSNSVSFLWKSQDHGAQWDLVHALPNAVPAQRPSGTHGGGDSEIVIGPKVAGNPGYTVSFYDLESLADIGVAWRAADGPSAFGDALEKSFHNPRLNLKLGPSDRKQLDVYMP